MILSEQSCRNQGAFPRWRTLLLAAFLLVPSQVFAGQLVVTNVNDKGPGSLRQALLDLQQPSLCPRPCEVIFNIEKKPKKPGTAWVIEPRTPLPQILGTRVTIDASTQTLHHGDTNPYGPEVILSGALAGPASGLTFTGPTGPPLIVADLMVRGLGFHSWEHAGVAVTGAIGQGLRPCVLSRVSVLDSSFGLDAMGNPAPNGLAIRMTFVADTVITGNVISGNGEGIVIGGGQRIHIARNNIGMDSTMATVLGNGTTGVRFQSVGESLVAGNVIAGHPVAAVVVTSSLNGNEIRRNQMIGNGSGIDLQGDGPTPNDAGDLDSGPNDLQNHPVLLSVAGGVLHGVLDSTASSDFEVDIYETGDPSVREGARSLGSVTVTTDPAGLASFSFAVPPGSGPYYSATATSVSTRSTSEFSAPVN